MSLDEHDADVREAPASQEVRHSGGPGPWVIVLGLLGVAAASIELAIASLGFPRNVAAALIALSAGLGSVGALIKARPRRLLRWSAVTIAAFVAMAATLWNVVPHRSEPVVAIVLRAGDTGSTDVTLTWAAPANYPLTNYVLYRDDKPIAYPVQTTYTDSGLTPASTHTYYVVAVAGSRPDPAPRSALIHVTTLALASLNPPATLSYTQLSDVSVTLQWDHPTGPPPARFRLVRNKVPVTLISGSDLTYQDSGLRPNTVYVYTIRSVDPAGRDSTDSAPLSVTTPPSGTPPYTAPSIPRKVRTSSVTTTSITVSWTAPSVTGTGGIAQYVVSGGGKQYVVTGTSYTFRGLAAATTYTFEVTATSRYGLMSRSAEVTVSTRSPLPSLGNLSITGLQCTVGPVDGTKNLVTISYYVTVTGTFPADAGPLTTEFLDATEAPSFQRSFSDVVTKHVIDSSWSIVHAYPQAYIETVEVDQANRIAESREDDNTAKIDVTLPPGVESSTVAVACS